VDVLRQVRYLFLKFCFLPGYAGQIGADAYAMDAGESVATAKKLLSQL